MKTVDSFYVKKFKFFFERPTFLPSVLHFKVFNKGTLACLKYLLKFFKNSTRVLQKSNCLKKIEDSIIKIKVG